MKELIFKLKLYGPINFIKFSFIEAYRITLRKLNISYSQFQEDVFVQKLLNKKSITYIDVGANHPIKFNNTYKFYLGGGKGINIEPNSIFSSEFQKIRPHDINLNLGLSNKDGELLFYSLNPHVASTFSKEEALKSIKSGCELVEKKQVPVATLSAIFKKYYQGSGVDFISIDTESYDYQVLTGNDWDKYRPKVICIESDTPEVQKLLKTKNYKKIRTLGLNNIYIDQKYEKFNQ